MAKANFPPFDWSRFQWRPSPSDPKLLQREVWGTETVMDVQTRFVNGESTLFLALELDFTKNVSVPDFLAAAREAWMGLRFEVPTIAGQMRVAETQHGLITYRLPASFSEVQDWTERTVTLAKDGQDLEGLRYELQWVPPGPEEYPTKLYITHEGGRLTGLMIQTTHAIFDGVGLEILMTRYLKRVAHVLAGDSVEAASTLKWGEEAKNLLPCASEILSAAEPREGPVYTKTLAEVLGDIGDSFPRMHAFKKWNVAFGPSRHLQRRFTAEESQQIHAAAKSHGSTVNQLFHAALCLVVAIDNPPTSETPKGAAFVFYGIMNARRHGLLPPYNERSGYPGNCFASNAIILPVDILRDKKNYEDKGLLLEMAEMVKAEYRKQRETPALLAVSGQLFDLMLTPVLQGAPSPHPSGAPSYSGDGVGENYLDPSYPDAAGKEVLSIRSQFSSINQSRPGPFFRACSWRGSMQVDVDFNESAMPREVVEGYMDDWVRVVKLIIT